MSTATMKNAMKGLEQDVANLVMAFETDHGVPVTGFTIYKTDVTEVGAKQRDYLLYVHATFGSPRDLEVGGAMP